MGFLANMLLTGETPSVASIDWSNIITQNSFSGLLDGISDVLPVVVPVGLIIAGVPVVWKFVKRMMRG